jgi:hypothetical protein
MGSLSDEELKERQFKRLKRWWNSLSPKLRQMLQDDWKSGATRESMFARGWVDGKGDITPLGRLKLHQLNLLKHMAGISDEECARMAQEELERQQATQQGLNAPHSLFEE